MPYGSKLHIPSPSCSTKAIQKSLSLKFMKNHREFSAQKNGPLAEKMTEQNEQQDKAAKHKRRQKGGIKSQPWDSRQEMDIRHHSLPLGAWSDSLLRRLRGKCIKGLWREATQCGWSSNEKQHKLLADCLEYVQAKANIYFQKND